MGVDVLPAWLEAIGLPAGSVLVRREPGGVPDGADEVWVVRPGAPDDEAGTGTWDVYWVQDGVRHSWTRFDEEGVACFALFGRLAWAQMMRGALSG